jgi:hypothetical protein
VEESRAGERRGAEKRRAEGTADKRERNIAIPKTIRRVYAYGRACGGRGGDNGHFLDHF